MFRTKKQCTPQSDQRSLSPVTTKMTVLIVAICVILAVNIILLTYLYKVREISSSKNEINNFYPQIIYIAEPTPAPAAAQPKEIVLNEKDTELVIYAFSSEEDLYVKVRNGNDEIIDEEFILEIQYPEGAVEKICTDYDGECYIDDLASGEYKISINEKVGFLCPEPLYITVKRHTERVYISNVSEIVDISSPEDMSDEIKTTPVSISASEESEEIEQISTVIDDVYTENLTQTVNDSDDKELFLYSFKTDENGFIYYADSDEISNVLVIYEDIYPYGIICTEEYDELGNPTGEWVLTDERVELVYPDNSLNQEYVIFAEPKPETVETTQVTGWQIVDEKCYYYDSNGEMITGLKMIDEKIYFFSPNGEKASSLGIDVSQFNGQINWDSVKAAGIDFAVIRLGGRGWESGKLYVDSKAKINLYQAKKSGLKIGAYFYSTAIDIEEAIQEASFAIDILEGIQLDLPIFFDTELSGDAPNGRADRLSPALQGQIASAFCDTCINTGYSAGVYSNLYYFYSSIHYTMISDYPIWMASYTYNYTLPEFSYKYNMWQFTSTGSIPGIIGCADLNVVF